jgi:ribosomal protein S18 acetylase RimI-like enzyme
VIIRGLVPVCLWQTPLRYFGPEKPYAMSLSFRPAVPEDASSIAALSIEVWLGTYLCEGVNAHFADFALAEFTAQAVAARMRDPARRFVVSQNAVGIDGYIQVRSGADAPLAGLGTVEIDTLYVQPRHHGTGIGRGLLLRGLQIAQDLGARDVWLTMEAGNHNARAFYLAQGFRKVGETHFRIGDGAYLNDVLSIEI